MFTVAALPPLVNIAMPPLVNALVDCSRSWSTDRRVPPTKCTMVIGLGRLSLGISTSRDYVERSILHSLIFGVQAWGVNVHRVRLPKGWSLSVDVKNADVVISLCFRKFLEFHERRVTNSTKGIASALRELEAIAWKCWNARAFADELRSAIVVDELERMPRRVVHTGRLPHRKPRRK
jgi:hypothetical protein